MSITKVNNFDVDKLQALDINLKKLSDVFAKNVSNSVTDNAFITKIAKT